MRPMKRVLIADDHALFRKGLRMLLADEFPKSDLRDVDSLDAALEALSADPVDLAILDLRMPGMNGAESLRAVREAYPETAVLVLSASDARQDMLGALGAGVHGYVVKSQTGGDLLRAIHEVSQDRVYLSPGISRIVIDAYRHRDAAGESALTVREREVLQLIAEGHRTKQVAVRLGISIKTAESHRTRIMSKLDIHETAGLIRYAIRNGLISP